MMKHVKSKLLFIVGLYALTVIIQSKSCKRIEGNYAVQTIRPLELGYIPLENVFTDICGKRFDNQSTVSITLTIWVKDKTTNKPVKWVYAGVTNPQKYTKSDLRFAGKYGTTPNCIFSNLPGNNVEFMVSAEIIGDCCSSCTLCNTNGVQYYGKIRYEGESGWNIWTKEPNGGSFLTSSVRVIPYVNCLYDTQKCHK
jgi:hypothetical protein